MSGFISNITYEGAFAVTTSDTTDDPHGPFAALYVGAAGAVSVVMVNGQSVTLPGVPAGTTLRIAVKRVNTTGTTVATPGTNIIGLCAMPFKGKP
jgi:hypothetical protein